MDRRASVGSSTGIAAKFVGSEDECCFIESPALSHVRKVFGWRCDVLPAMWHGFSARGIEGNEC